MFASKGNVSSFSKDILLPDLRSTIVGVPVTSSPSASVAAKVMIFDPLPADDKPKSSFA
jgi:hypothetical protein